MALTHKSSEIEGGLATGSSVEFVCNECHGIIIFDGYVYEATCPCGYKWTLNDITASGVKWIEKADNGT